MDHYFIFTYVMKTNKQNGEEHLNQVTLKKLNPNNQFQYQAEDVKKFKLQSLSDNIDKFKKMIKQILSDIYQLNSNFINVVMVSTSNLFFQQIMIEQCRKSKISYPYVLQNYIDIFQIVRLQYQCPYSDLKQMTKYLKINMYEESKDKEDQDHISQIIKLLYKDKRLQDTHLKFSNGLPQRRKPSNKEQVSDISYKYFKVIGLPFRIFEPEVLSILAPEIPQQQKQVVFITQNQRFSGKGIVKVPKQYEKKLVQKNRMYIGNRYIQLQSSSLQIFERFKIQKQKNDKYSSTKTQRRSQHKDQRNLPFRQQNQRIGRGYQRQRSRSRQNQRKRDNFNNFNSSGDNYKSDSSFNLNSGQHAIKVRGLPFSFTQWDVENIFSFYNIVAGSVKLGIKQGTNLKNGQAVILTRSYNDAQKALDNGWIQMHGQIFRDQNDLQIRSHQIQLTLNVNSFNPYIQLNHLQSVQCLQLNSSLLNLPYFFFFSIFYNFYIRFLSTFYVASQNTKRIFYLLS